MHIHLTQTDAHSKDVVCGHRRGLRELAILGMQDLEDWRLPPRRPLPSPPGDDHCFVKNSVQAEETPGDTKEYYGKILVEANPVFNAWRWAESALHERTLDDVGKSQDFGCTSKVYTL